MRELLRAIFTKTPIIALLDDPKKGGMVYDDANADTAPGTVPGGPSAFAPAGGGDVTENRVRSPRAQEAAHTLLAGAFPGAAGWRGSPLRPPARS